MRQIQYSSGDLLVDRRAAFAEAMALNKDFGAAAEVMADALAVAPHWAAGWLLLGDYRTEAGDSAGAMAAYRQVEVLDVAGVFGAATKLAAHGGGALPGGTDTPYVEALFDEYAPRFEAELVADLGYSVPPLLGRMIAAALAGQPAVRAVDLGCGTGLMGAEVRGFCDRLEGIDLSARMLAEARRKHIYDELQQAELLQFLSTDRGGIDLLTAADVLIYCGPLPPVLAAAYAALAPGGLFGFSLELHDRPGTLLQRRQLRYAHNAGEALAACEAAGFEIAASERTGIRRERGVPVDGLVLLLRKLP
jgi:predicted TPR repeat methyltransferase